MCYLFIFDGHEFHVTIVESRFGLKTNHTGILLLLLVVHNNTNDTKAQARSSINSMIPFGDEHLLAGLSHDKYEATQLSAAFWESVWPKLVESGWEAKVSTNSVRRGQ